jgi:hypothetical protein
MDMTTTYADLSQITRIEALRLYRAGNNLGLGYAPYTDEAGDDTIDAAIDAAEADGWTLVHSRDQDDQVAVLRNDDGDVLAIGGDAMGRNAWAVPLCDVPADSEDA